jgi:hypothetical protein
MNNKSRILWITRTAVFIALLVVLQVSTAPLGNIFITGSAVNLLLVVSVMTCGLSSGITVCLLSPVLAKLVGIGPLWSLIPFIILGNLTVSMVWYFITRKTKANGIITYIFAIAAAAIMKFLILYLGIVKLAVPFLLGLPEKQASVISGMFSLPQLITALIGGVIAAMILPILQRSMKRY